MGLKHYELTKIWQKKAFFVQTILLMYYVDY